MGKGKKWSEEDIRYLDENWGRRPVESICQKLGRSENAINIKVNKMGLGAFLNRDEYITYSQLLMYLGTTVSNYKSTSWIKNRDFPVKYKKVNKKKFRIVYLDDFWKWASEYRHFIDWTKVKKECLGKEPDWLIELRRNQKETQYKLITTSWTKTEDSRLKRLIESHQYNYLDLTKILKRSAGAIERRLYKLNIKARPVKPNNHIKYSESEKRLIREMVLDNKTYLQISELVNKSDKAIRGYLYRTYGTENLDKVRKNIIEMEKKNGNKNSI